MTDTHASAADAVAVAALLERALHLALDAEAAAACAAAPFERSAGRRARRGGTTRRRLASPFGAIELRVPRIAGGGFRPCTLPAGTRRLDHLAETALRLAAGVNSWGAAQALVEPLRRTHGDAEWVRRAARRILADAEARRLPPMPPAAAELRIAPLADPHEARLLRVQRIAASPASGGPPTVWFAAATGDGAWDAITARLHDAGLRTVALAVLPASSACAAAIHRRWPECRIASGPTPINGG